MCTWTFGQELCETDRKTGVSGPDICVGWVGHHDDLPVGRDQVQRGPHHRGTYQGSSFQVT